MACAFHSPLIAARATGSPPSSPPSAFAAPHARVFSNVTANLYPSDPDVIAGLLAEHLVSPVRFLR